MLYPASVKIEDCDDIPDYGESLQADNNRRAIRAARVLAAYRAMVGEDTVETSLSDMLADLLHLCDAIGSDFAELEAVARMHYRDELGGNL